MCECFDNNVETIVGIQMQATAPENDCWKLCFSVFYPAKYGNSLVLCSAIVASGRLKSTVSTLEAPIPNLDEQYVWTM